VGGKLREALAKAGERRTRQAMDDWCALRRRMAHEAADVELALSLWGRGRQAGHLEAWRDFAAKSQSSSAAWAKAVAGHALRAEAGEDSYISIAQRRSRRDAWERWWGLAQRKGRAASVAVADLWMAACANREERRKRRCFTVWRHSSRQKEASKAMMRRAALLGFLPEKRAKPPPRRQGD